MFINLKNWYYIQSTIPSFAEFGGIPDPLHGNLPYQAVRKTAKVCVFRGIKHSLENYLTGMREKKKRKKSIVLQGGDTVCLHALTYTIVTESGYKVLWTWNACWEHGLMPWKYNSILLQAIKTQDRTLAQKRQEISTSVINKNSLVSAKYMCLHENWNVTPASVFVLDADSSCSIFLNIENKKIIMKILKTSLHRLFVQPGLQ